MCLWLLVKSYIPSSSTIWMLTVLNGSTEALSTLPTTSKFHSRVSVGSRETELSTIVKLIWNSTSLGVKMICWSMTAPVSACKAGAYRYQYITDLTRIGTRFLRTSCDSQYDHLVSDSGPVYKHARKTSTFREGVYRLSEGKGDI